MRIVAGEESESAVPTAVAATAAVPSQEPPAETGE
jgi:hypothetical protein